MAASLFKLRLRDLPENPAARKLLQKREILIVQVEFDKIIGIERPELCIVNV